MTAAPPIRVLLIGASPILRRLLAMELDRTGDLHALTCDDQIENIRARLLQHHPDVIVLDLDLPRDAALPLLDKLHAYYPVPVIGVLGHDPGASTLALAAAERGASRVVRKPLTARHADYRIHAGELAEHVRSVCRANWPLVAAGHPDLPGQPSFRAAALDPARFCVLLGASTGGTQAIAQFLRTAPADFPPLVIVQHMPARFTPSFARQLNEVGPLRVREAPDGEALSPGRAVVARGDRQLTIVRSALGWTTRYTDQVPVNGHCPSVDVLFDSGVAFGPQIIGVLLTGMGADGAAGLLRLRQTGALTFAQDQSSCVVFGMPKEAERLGAVQEFGPPSEIPTQILRALARPKPARPRPLAQARK